MQITLNKVLVGVIMILAGALEVSFWQADRAEREYLNTLAENGKLVTERDHIWSKLLITQDRIIALQRDSAFKDLKINDLLDVVKKKDARITALVAFQAIWKPDTVTIPGTQDTVFVPGGSGRQRVTFNTEIQGDSIKGYTLTTPPETHLSLWRRPVSFAVAMIEGESGAYETVLTSDNPYLTITAATGQVIQYAQGGFLRRFIDGPAISGGWTIERGVVLTADVAVWKIRPYIEAYQGGLDYGGRIELYQVKW